MAKKKRHKTARENARRRAQERHDSGSNYSCIKLPEGVKFFSTGKGGVKRFDIVGYTVSVDHNPYADNGDYHYERTFFVHRGIGPNRETVICLAKTFKKKCPICEHRAELARKNADEDVIKELAPKERQLYNVIDLQDRDAGVKVWDVSYFLFGRKLDAEIRNADEDDDFDTFADLENGKTLKVSMEEKSLGGRSFCEAESINFKDRREDYDEDLEVVDLDKALQPLPYDELKKMLIDDEDVEVEEEEEEAPKKKRKTRSKKPDPEPEEDEDEEEEPEEAEEAEEEEESDGEEEEEEEEEKPKKKAKKKKATKKKPEAGKCPHGGTFGKDCDSLEACDDCELWDECDEACG